MNSTTTTTEPGADAAIRITLPKLHSGQRKVMALRKRFNVLECGRRFGKSKMGLYLDCRTALRGHPAGWFAPTYKYLLPIFQEARKRLAPITIRASQQEMQIDLMTGGSIDFWSLDDPDAGRGRRYKRVAIDEASLVRGLRDAWNGSIRPTLTDFRGDAWLFGTPKGHNDFHHLFNKGEQGDDGWMSCRLGTVDNPYISPDEIADARRDLPTHIFEQEYLGIPAPDGGNPFGLDAITACLAPLSTARPFVWGWDLAKSQDWTVGIALSADGAVCRFERWQGPWGATREKIRTMTGSTWAIVDSTGVGDPVLEDLQRGTSNFEGFKFSSPSKQQLMEGLAVAIQQQQIRFPDGPIREELDTFEYEYTKTGVRYSAPEGLHDDCVCALALGVHGWQQRSGIIAPAPTGPTRVSPWRM